MDLQFHIKVYHFNQLRQQCSIALKQQLVHLTISYHTDILPKLGLTSLLYVKAHLVKAIFAE